MRALQFDLAIPHMTTRALRFAALAIVATLLAGFGNALHAQSASSSATATTTNSPPPLLLGLFDDDYSGHFSISATQFIQLPRGRFNIVEWHATEQFFIAQNDSLNRSDPNKWTRIDWLPLTGMEPYTWAFCFSAYKANTRAEALAATTAKRDTPRTGCNGFPFTRMKRTTEAN